MPTPVRPAPASFRRVAAPLECGRGERWRVHSIHICQGDDEDGRWVANVPLKELELLDAPGWGGAPRLKAGGRPWRRGRHGSTCRASCVIDCSQAEEMRYFAACMAAARTAARIRIYFHPRRRRGRMSQRQELQTISGVPVLAFDMVRRSIHPDSPAVDSTEGASAIPRTRHADLRQAYIDDALDLLEGGLDTLTGDLAIEDAVQAAFQRDLAGHPNGARWSSSFEEPLAFAGGALQLVRQVEICSAAVAAAAAATPAGIPRFTCALWPDPYPGARSFAAGDGVVVLLNAWAAGRGAHHRADGRLEHRHPPGAA